MRGIYRIVNKVNGKCYVGRSDNAFTRAHQHFTLLHSGKHPSKKMQEEYSKDGLPNFAMELLERCNLGNIKEKEVFYIRKFKAIEEGYNVAEPLDFSASELTRERKETLIKKAFTKIHPDVRPAILYMGKETLDGMLPIFSDDIESLRAKEEILILPDEYVKYRKVPYIFIEKDFD